MSWLGDLHHDAGHSLRALAKVPGFAFAAVATLALGIGATTAIFSVVEALLLKPLPYAADADRLVRLNALVPEASPGAPPRRLPVVMTADEARELMARTAMFDGVGIVAPTVVSIRGVDDAGHVGAVRISAAALALLDARPLLGRSIVVADETGDGDVALLGFAAWHRLFSGDPGVIGRTLTLQTVLGPRASRSVTVIGVMPQWFAFPGADTDLWMPPDRAASQPLRGRLLARLAPGVTLEAARDAVAPLVRTMREHGPDVRYELVGERDELVRPVRPAVLVLAAAVAVLLLIACLNVANLLLARALARSRELSVRAALGASRSRLARQCLTESAVLGVLGGAGGLAIAACGPGRVPRSGDRVAAHRPRHHRGRLGLHASSRGWVRSGSTAPSSPSPRQPLWPSDWRWASPPRFAPRAPTSSAPCGSPVPPTAAAATRRSPGGPWSSSRWPGPRRCWSAPCSSPAVCNTWSTTDPGYTAANVLTFQVVLPTPRLSRRASADVRRDDGRAPARGAGRRRRRLRQPAADGGLA